MALITLLIGLFLTAAFAIETKASTHQLDNGLQVIYEEKHGSPMVAAVVFVKSGSKYETRYENGITHFLEHLLFDGTANLSREELDRSVRDLGGYINAFTREDLTCFFVLVPKQYIDYGMTVQADMLFNSVFPEEELEKERKVVIEEINGSLDAPGYSAETFFTQKAYAGTGYELSTLGYREFIENIPREAIIAYYKKYYTPDNMVMLLIGDFETEAMKATVEAVFGGFKSASTDEDEAASGIHERTALDIQRREHLIGQQRFDTVASVTSTRINFSIEAPQVSRTDYLPFNLLISYLSLDETSPLLLSLQSEEAPLASNVSLWLETREEFSRLNISAEIDNPDHADTVIQVVLTELANLSQHQADPELLDGIRTSNRCNAIYAAEKLHYYSFIISPMMMSAGWEYIQQYPDLLDSVRWNQCQAAAEHWLKDPAYVVTVIRPATDDETPYEPGSMTSEEVIAHFDSVSFPEYTLAENPIEFPDVDSVSLELTDPATYHREVLDNGLTVIVKSSPDSKVFAVNILGKNRMANEPEGKSGITDFVNRCLETGTLSHDAAQLAGALRKIGANLTVSDNPWIPYDDRYTTRRYSFVKFETINEFAEDGFALLADLILNPAFDSGEVESIRRQMLGVVGRATGSPSKVARSLYYETLFGDHPFARPITGAAMTISAITVDDLREYHRSFYAPENMILTIAGGRDTAEIMSWVQEHFADMPKVGTAVSEVPLPIAAPSLTEAHRELDKQQVSIYAGGRLPGANSGEAVDLSIATSILSSRLYLSLREKQGLAYSTGVGRRFDRDFGWYYLVISTASENFQRALDGLTLQTEKLAFDGPTDQEISIARNQLWGALMRAKLSCINQAFYMGVDEFYGRGVDYDNLLLKRLSKVDVQSVRREASRHFRPETWVVTSAGKKN